MPFNLDTFRNTPFNLQYVFAGSMFQWKNQYQIGAGGLANFQLKCSTSKIVHLISKTLQTASSAMTFSFYEKGVKTDGTLSTTGLINVNRSSIITNTAQIRTSPTTSTGGASLTTPITLVSYKLVANSATLQLEPELILKSNTSYLFTIKSGGGAGKVDFNFVWYETSN